MINYSPARPAIDSPYGNADDRGDLRRFSQEKQLEFGRGLRDGMPRRRLAELSGEQRRIRSPSLPHRTNPGSVPCPGTPGAHVGVAVRLLPWGGRGDGGGSCRHRHDRGPDSRSAATLISPISASSPHVSAHCCSTSTILMKPQWGRGNGMSSVWSRMAILGHDFGMSDDDVRQTAARRRPPTAPGSTSWPRRLPWSASYLKTTALEVLDLVSRLSKSASKLATETVSKASRNTSHRALRKLTTTTVDGHYRIVEQQDIAVRVGDGPVRGGRNGRRVLRFGARGCGRPAGLSPVQDAVVRVVGVGSVGTRCYLALLTDADGSPLFLQMKRRPRRSSRRISPRNCAGSTGAGWWRASASCKPAVTPSSGT